MFTKYINSFIFYHFLKILSIFYFCCIPCRIKNVFSVARRLFLVKLLAFEAAGSRCSSPAKWNSVACLIKFMLGTTRSLRFPVLAHPSHWSVLFI